MIGLLAMAAALTAGAEIKVPNGRPWLSVQLLDSCTNGVPMKQDACAEYVDGVIEALEQDFFDHTRKRDFCIPENMFLAEAFKRALPQLEGVAERSMNEPAPLTVHRWMMKAFPCRH